MCYTQGMSFTFFTIGLFTTVYSMTQKPLRQNYFPVCAGFYTVMELSQAIQYSFVNQCDNTWNKILSEIAYIFVLAQPLMFHVIGFLRNHRIEDKAIFKSSIAMYLVWILFSIWGRLVYDDTDNDWSYIYGNQSCTLRYTPTSHLYWQWTGANMKDYNANMLSYLLIWFVPPFFVKKERKTHTVVISSFLIGTLLTYLSGRWQEHASIWCFVSIPITVMFYVSHMIANFTKVLAKNQ